MVSKMKCLVYEGLTVACYILFAFFIAMVIFIGIGQAGEKEELQLKQQFLQERMARIELQSQVLQLQYTQNQKELQEVTLKLQGFEKKVEDDKK